jgi:hypothetical protein
VLQGDVGSTAEAGFWHIRRIDSSYVYLGLNLANADATDADHTAYYSLRFF